MPIEPTGSDIDRASKPMFRTPFQGPGSQAASGREITTQLDRANLCSAS